MIAQTQSSRSLDHSGGENSGGGDSELTGEILGLLSDWTFLVAREEDARWLENLGFRAVEWTRRDLPGAIRGRKVILIAPDSERSQRFARNIGNTLAERGVATFRVWVLAGFGSRSASLREWCTGNDFSASLMRDKPWQEVCQAVDEPVTSVGAPRAQPPRFTGNPRPIEIELLPVARLDDELIPAPLRGWVVDIAERGGYPLEYPAAAAIVGLSGLIGRRIALRPKRADDWLVVPNLWGAVVGPPGVQKTPAVEEPLRPLRQLAAAAWKSQVAVAASFDKDRMVAEARQEAARLALRKAARQGKPDDELARLAADASLDNDPLVATSRRYLVHDATVEKLGELLAENPNGLTLFRDELIGFLRSMDRQGHESDRGFYLEAWNGSNAYAYDRIGRGTIMIPNTCLAIFGTIQPGPLARYLRASASGEEADGFMPRFQVLVYPDPVVTFINVDRRPDTRAREMADAVFQALDQLDPDARGCKVDAERGMPFLGIGARRRSRRGRSSGRADQRKATQSVHRPVGRPQRLVRHYVRRGSSPCRGNPSGSRLDQGGRGADGSPERRPADGALLDPSAVDRWAGDPKLTPAPPVRRMLQVGGKRLQILCFRLRCHDARGDRRRARDSHRLVPLACCPRCAGASEAWATERALATGQARQGGPIAPAGTPAGVTGTDKTDKTSKTGLLSVSQGDAPCKYHHFKCLCRNAKVPLPLIMWGPVKTSMAQRSPMPSLAS
jgi:hypothetical protein